MAVYIGDKNLTEVVAGNALDSAKQYADQGDANTLQQAKEYTDSEVSQFEADYKQADATVLSEAKQYADQNMIPKSQKGQPGGLAELDETGRVPSSQLPSYVDDVIDVDTYSNLPNPGESGKIYITTDNNKQYRWSGTGYAEISSSLALGTTSETAGRGDWTQAAYNHSLITNGSNPHGTTFASLPDKPTSLPANGGNADTVGGLGVNDLVSVAGNQTITGWKRFNPSTKNGVFNTTGIIDNKDTYATPLSWTAKTDGSIWNIQQESDSITLIGIQGGKAIKFLSNPSLTQVIADLFTGTANKARQDKSGNDIDKTYISFNNTTAYTPTSQYNPATKGYVDSLVGTYILDMDNILAYISSSGSTPISQSNSQILQSIQSSVLDGNMPRAFGKYTVQNNEDPAYPANSSISWQLTDAATIDETPGAVYMSFTCLAGGSSGPKVRTLAIIVLADGQVMSSGDSGWLSAGGSSGGLVIPASGEQAATGWTYNGKQVYVQRFTGSMVGSGNTIQYATISIPNLSFLVLKSGTISYSNFNYEIGEVQFAADGTNAIVSQITPTYGTNGNVSLRIYDLNQNSGWTYELWLAYTK